MVVGRGAARHRPAKKLVFWTDGMSSLTSVTGVIGEEHSGACTSGRPGLAERQFSTGRPLIGLFETSSSYTACAGCVDATQPSVGETVVNVCALERRQCCCRRCSGLIHNPSARSI